MAPQGVVEDAQPALSATFTDDVGVVPGGTVLTLDGVRLTLDVSTDHNVAATPPAPLAAGLHHASLTVRDGGGRATTRNWTFQVVLPPQEARILAVSFSGGLVREVPDVTVRYEGASLAATLDGAALAVPARPGEVTLDVGALADGPHTLVLVAEGANGSREERSIAFSTDATPPTLAFIDVKELPEAVTVSWTDANGVRPDSVRALLDGAGLPARLGADGGRLALPPVGPGGHLITIEVTDVVGNVARAEHRYVVEEPPREDPGHQRLIPEDATPPTPPARGTPGPGAGLLLLALVALARARR